MRAFAARVISAPGAARAASWLLAIGGGWVIGIALLVPHARSAHERAAALDGTGVPAVPGGEALSAVGASGIAVAAAAFALTIGVLAGVIGQVGGELVGRRSWTARATLGMFIAAAAAGPPALAGAPGLGGAFALLCLLSYAAHLGAAHYTTPRRPGRKWLAALVLLAPAALTADGDAFRDARTALLALPGGESVVNAYYRHALLAAEPLKDPGQRLVLTYYYADGERAPDWFDRSDTPALWVAVAEPQAAQARLHQRSDGRLALSSPAAATRSFGSGDAEAALARWREAETPTALRALVAAGLLLALPLAAAALLAAGLGRALGMRSATGPLAASAVSGVLLAVALHLAGREVEPVVEGSGAQRMAAAVDPGTSDAALAGRLSEDRLLPVRARALAERIRRAEEPADRRECIAAAATWYEQWYGLRALLARGWRPPR